MEDCQSCCFLCFFFFLWMDPGNSRGELKTERPDSFLTPVYEKQSTWVHTFLFLSFRHMFNQFVHSNVHVIFKWTTSATFQAISSKSACRSSIMLSPVCFSSLCYTGTRGKTPALCRIGQNCSCWWTRGKKWVMMEASFEVNLSRAVNTTGSWREKGGNQKIGANGCGFKLMVDKSLSGCFHWIKFSWWMMGDVQTPFPDSCDYRQ